MLSRNDPTSGMRVFRSGRAHGLASAQRGVFTRGRLRFIPAPLGASVLSANGADVARPGHGLPSRPGGHPVAQASAAHPHEVRIAFDGDAVLFSDEAERCSSPPG